MIVRYEGYKSSPVPGGTLGQVEATLYDMHQDTWDENMHQEKKIHYGIFFIFVQKKVSTIRFQEIKIRP